MQRTVTDYSIYRFRYIIGYIVLIIGIAVMLVLAGLYVPGGIRSQEVEAITTSSIIAFQDFDPSTIVNLPYHVLQRFSLELFGVSTISIKLSSIVLGIVAITGIHFLVREWFRNNIAVITTLLAATTPLFLFMAQDGTPLIYVAAISAWLLYAATMVSRRKHPTFLWKLLLFLLLALNLYTPLGIYLNLAIATTVLFHPHIRFTLKRINTSKIIIASSISLIALVPLIYSITTEPTLGLTLLGLPNSMPNLAENATLIVLNLFNFLGGSASGAIQPMVSLGLAIVMLIGVYRFILVKYTARSYIIWLWSGLLMPFILLQPQYLPYLFVLAMLMVAMGISSIVTTWYNMFPNNPYARVAGLIPLSVIVIGISLSGVNRYALSYIYSPDIKQYFSKDIQLLTEAKNKLSEESLTIVVDSAELPLYSLYAHYDNTIVVTEQPPKRLSNPIVFSVAARAKYMPTGTINSIVTDSRADNGARFYVYTPTSE